MNINYLPTLIIIFSITIGFPYGFKMFCKLLVYVYKVRAIFTIQFTKLKCNLIKAKAIIKLHLIEKYQYIRTKIWINRYYRKQIKMSFKKGEIETACEMKKIVKSINKLEREKFMQFADYFTNQLAKLLKETA